MPVSACGLPQGTSCADKMEAAMDRNSYLLETFRQFGSTTLYIVLEPRLRSTASTAQKDDYVLRMLALPPQHSQGRTLHEDM